MAVPPIYTHAPHRISDYGRLTAPLMVALSLLSVLAIAGLAVLRTDWALALAVALLIAEIIGGVGWLGRVLREPRSDGEQQALRHRRP